MITTNFTNYTNYHTFMNRLFLSYFTNYQRYATQVLDVLFANTNISNLTNRYVLFG